MTVLYELPHGARGYDAGCRCRKCQRGEWQRRNRKDRVPAKHNYAGYANGCRCDVCRKAKADYMHNKRAEARANPREPARHGTRFGYDEAGCRCGPCTRARRLSDKRYRMNKENREQQD